jgi:predicted RNase H-like HicB family nuclease
MCSHSDKDLTGLVFKKRNQSMIQAQKILIERDTQGHYVATLPGLAGGQTQARSLKMLMARIQELTARAPEAALQEVTSASPDRESGQVSSA